MTPAVLAILNHERTREHLRRIVRGWYDEYIDGWAHRIGEVDVDPQPERFFPDGKIYWQSNKIDMLSKLQPIIEELPQPAPLTAEDLRRAAISHLTVHPDQFGTAYTRFIAALEAMAPAKAIVDHRFRASERIGSLADHTGIWRESLTKELPLQIPGLQVSIEPSSLSMDSTGSNQKMIDLSAVFAADGWTNRAFRSAAREGSRVLRSGFQTLVYAGHFNEGFQPLAADREFNAFELEPDRTGVQALTRQLEWFWSRPTKKDTLARRMRNSVQFLLLADESKHVTVRLALCCSALEALLIPAGVYGDISDTLARNASTLLQRDRLQRPAGFEGVKWLYKLRSRMMHGESAEEHHDGATAARALAGGIQIAVLESAAFLRRIHEIEPTPDKFFERIKEAGISGDQMDGVPDRLVRCLPKAPAPNSK